MNRLAFVLTLLASSTALAQVTEEPPAPTPPGPPAPQPTTDASDPTSTSMQPPTPTVDPSVAPTTPPPDDKKAKEPKRGDFDAGGQARFPNGPDENNEFATFNWVAVDLKGRYYLLKQIFVSANFPIAVKKPDTIGPMGPEPSIFGGGTLSLDARIEGPKMPGLKYETIVGLNLTTGYMREGAMLLSEKDYPRFIGDMKPGFAGGLITKLSLSSLLKFSLLPTWVYQSGSMQSLTAIQIPMALEVALGSLLKVNVELGVYTGDDYSFSADNGGRITAGASLDVKLGPMLLHAGAGVASLITGTGASALYPSISDSFYVDLNAKYAK